MCRRRQESCWDVKEAAGILLGCAGELSSSISRAAKGHFLDAAASTKQELQLGSPRPHWGLPSSCSQQNPALLNPKNPAFLKAPKA